MRSMCTEYAFSMPFRPHTPEGESGFEAFRAGKCVMGRVCTENASQCFSGLALQKEKGVWFLGAPSAFSSNLGGTASSLEPSAAMFNSMQLPTTQR